LAPEFLDETMVTNRFNSYVNLDIYALALVFWEVARRMEYSLVAWGALPYEPPYFEFVPRDPTIEEMRQCVCVEGHRPTIPDDWKNSGVCTIT
jgi:TGF-beta receptor type-2